MSNRLCITSTEFKNNRTGGTTFGVRIYDDYDCFYDNFWDEDNVSHDLNDLDILKKVLKDTVPNSEGVSNMLDFIQEHEKGIEIDDQWYDWDEIKHLFK